MKIMSNFKISTINASKTVFPGTPVFGYSFHIGQFIYRRVQTAGLQEQYNYKDGFFLKMYSCVLLRLAFRLCGPTLNLQLFL